MKHHQVKPVNPNRLANAIPTTKVTKTGNKINNIIIKSIPVNPAISNNFNIKSSRKVLKVHKGFDPFE